MCSMAKEIKEVGFTICHEMCGDSLDGIFCQQCTCKSCGKGAHIGYNCPPKAPIISNPEPCNQTIDELPQTLPSFDPTYYSEKENSLPYISEPNFVDDSPNVFNPPPQPPMDSCEFCISWAETMLVMVLFSSVEELVLIPSESEGISDGVCDVPLCDNPTPLKAFKDHSEIVVNSNNDDTSSDDDDFEDIEYVEASPPDLEIVSLEEVNKDQEEKEYDLEDIFQIQDIILREKLVNINRLIANIEALNDNPSPDHVLKSPSFSLDLQLRDSDRSLWNLILLSTLFGFQLFGRNSETFSDHTESREVNEPIGKATLIKHFYSDNSNDPLLEFPEFESFHFNPSFPRPSPESPDDEISLIVETDAPVINNFDELNEDECFDPGGDEIDVEDEDSFTFIIRTFLPYLTYPEVSPLLSSTKNEDTILTPTSPLRADGISSGWNFHIIKCMDIAKNHKKTVKAGQTRTRDDKEYTRAGDLIAERSKVNSSHPLVNQSQLTK
ncbi:hypothetical protein Tco_1112548 [Tanacetum coccineum]|uniref:CCHC-type domain-containing protein n=1 Tax=Tanacetum coccineum TaxID=301880 RepID=A0ABQ5IR54_9ASTR